MQPDKTVETTRIQTSPVPLQTSLRRVIAAEMLKQHRSLFGNKLTYFSLLIWPGLQLLTAYYMYKPFLGASGIIKNWTLASTPQGIFLFVTTGMLGFTFFWSLVQSAWQFSWERFNGTLELLFLTPVNRLALLVANGAMALIQSTWLFLVFSIGLIFLVGRLKVAHPAMFFVAFIGLFIPSVAWGAFLNSIFIFSRDAGFLYTILDEPMSFFAGVRIPLFALPVWVRVIGAIFPLALSLSVLRGSLLEAASLTALWPQLLALLGMSAVLIVAAACLLKWGEDHARRSGSLTLF
ncbi:MAG TPA: ABC transporter permease [Ktedonosporobacter sp.]|nr:ABC transporter permease [Ktedonosporobacter sp.]